MQRLMSRSNVATRATRAWRQRSVISSLSTAAKDSSVDAPTVADVEDVNQLSGKVSREHIHSAFASRAMAAVKYDYFAQRAELETELDAAAIFRALTYASKQQAMGFLELMEDYGDADFGNTLDNLEVSAQTEREQAETSYPAFATAAAEDGLDHVDTWFQDLSGASERAAERLELTASFLEPEELDEDDEANPSEANDVSPPK
eukprot:IDg5026t1